MMLLGLPLKSTTKNPLFKMLTISLTCFVLITAIGLGLGSAYYRQMRKIEVGCGADISSSVKSGWTAYCIRTYSRHHLGISEWWGPVFTIGATGTAVTAIWLGVAIGVYKKHRA